MFLGTMPFPVYLPSQYIYTHVPAPVRYGWAGGYLPAHSLEQARRVMEEEEEKGDTTNTAVCTEVDEGVDSVARARRQHRNTDTLNM